MFGNDSRPSRIYAYKAKPPTEGHADVAGQMSLAHRYRNRLVELERTRRDAVDDAVRIHAPDVLDLERQLAAADDAIAIAEAAIKGRNKEARARIGATADEKRALTALRSVRKETRTALKEAMAAAFQGDGPLRANLETIDADDAVARKTARAESGLYWGTYLLIEQSLMGVKKGAPPKFRRWNGEGSLAVQVQGGMAWTDVVAGGDNRVRVAILPPGPDADPDSRRSQEKHTAVAWLRVGSEGRAPKWAVVPFRLHRQPPEGSRIKWVYLHRSVVGRGSRWEVQFVIERENWDRSDAAPDGIVGLDANWRLTPDGLRVAYAIGDDGGEHTLVIPRDWLGGWSKVESLQSIRDSNFNEARAALASWRKDATIPDWFRERTEHMGQWRDPGRLSGLVWNWREQRFAGDEAIYTTMEAWRKQERHLHDWQDNQARKIVRRRDDLYRKFAAMLSRRYRTVVMEDTDWKRLNAVPLPDQEPRTAARIYARIGAAGRLCELVREAVAETIRVPAANTTKRCHCCGSIEDFDAATDLVYRCDACGAVWDQDRNAAINLLEAAPGAARAG